MIDLDWGYKGQPLDSRRGYRVYRNLHRQLWSIQGYVTGKGWRVVGHADSCVGTTGVKFVVNQTGRERVRREGRKNVHAFAEVGNIVRGIGNITYRYPTPIRYNPYDNDVVGAEGRGAFAIDGPNLAIGSAARCAFTPTGVRI